MSGSKCSSFQWRSYILYKLNRLNSSYQIRYYDQQLADKLHTTKVERFFNE